MSELDLRLLRAHLRGYKGRAVEIQAGIRMVMGLVACQYAHYKVHGTMETHVQELIEGRLGDIEEEISSLLDEFEGEDPPF
jgi:hypothetical protein